MLCGKTSLQAEVPVHTDIVVGAMQGLRAHLFTWWRVHWRLLCDALEALLCDAPEALLCDAPEALPCDAPEALPCDAPEALL